MDQNISLHFIHFLTKLYCDFNFNIILNGQETAVVVLELSRASFYLGKTKYNTIPLLRDVLVHLAQMIKNKKKWYGKCPPQPRPRQSLDSYYVYTI